MEYMPCCDNRSVAELTNPRVPLVSPVAEVDSGCRKTTEVASGNVLGPQKAFLPIHPPYLIVELSAFISAVEIQAARSADVTAYIVTRGVVRGYDLTCEAA